MALATLSPLLASLAGPVGPLTTQGSPAGISIRPRRVNQPPQAATIVTAQSHYKTAVALWWTLTDPQREAWHTYALTLRPWGKPAEWPHLSAYRAFLRTNLCCLGAGRPTHTDAPADYHHVPLPPAMSFRLSRHTLDDDDYSTGPFDQIVINGAVPLYYGPATGARLIYYVSKVTSNTRTPKRPATRFLTTYTSGTAFPILIQLFFFARPSVPDLHYLVVDVRWLRLDGGVGPVGRYTARQSDAPPPPVLPMVPEVLAPSGDDPPLDP